MFGYLLVFSKYTNEIDKGAFHSFCAIFSWKENSVFTVVPYQYVKACFLLFSLKNGQNKTLE